jgi:hypothetical protein
MAGARCWGSVKRLYFRGDAAFGNPRDVTSTSKPRALGYAIRLPANRGLDKTGSDTC